LQLNGKKKKNTGLELRESSS